MTDIVKTFVDGFDYVKQDWQKLLLIGVICVLGNLTAVLAGFGFKSFVGITSVIGIIATLVLCGLSLNIIKENIHLSNIIPDFDWANDLVNGIKFVVVQIVYFIIPTIITGIVALVSVNQDAVINLSNFIVENNGISNVPNNLIQPVMGSVSIIVIVALILFILFGLMSLVATCRLAQSNEITDALNFKAVISDVMNIGIISIVVWIILAMIIIIVIGMIKGLISMIPYIGVLLSELICGSIVLVLMHAAMGRLYNQLN